jgi:hypothetical protein
LGERFNVEKVLSVDDHGERQTYNLTVSRDNTFIVGGIVTHNSGLVVEHLKSVGILPHAGDWTAEGLAKRFQGREVTRVKPGCLLFWFRGQKIGHVEIVWHVVGERVLTIGAAGGGSRTKTKSDAEKQNAYIKVRPARPEWVKAVDPFV